ncbi:ABC transporter ATP-binding protein [Streptomyces rishiriensis]|uniref:ABC-2 type transport system ATP-binding protein n=1 Tax=Streptomyces rishiriensis TaxID=68264 RepID=A0ABU0NS43_STRRH|nr:ABC transporter ATP-binding protein [Streptomyces rishiriensis]MDQ0581917.1 ABC-2 type transport system ATP-binding protein [Streptomyces rishiriensis]
MTDTAMAATALGKRFGRRGGWALRDCTFRLPAGRVCAVVGPNGAGKSTLLALAAGLLAPTEGRVTVLGGDPASARARVGYVAQDKPLYPQLSVAETLRVGADLNPGRWDAETAGRIVAAGDLDPGKKIRSLSGGQRTRVALALALGKRPELLLLDEPMADLDPLARHELMGTLMARAAQYGTTIVMSSHVVAELEDSCDHLLLVGGGRVRLAGEIDDLLAAHTRVSTTAGSTGPTADGSPDGSADSTPGGLPELAPHTVVESRVTGRQLTALVRPAGPLADDWRTSTPSLEELVLAYLRNPQAAPLTPTEPEEAAV